MEGVFKINQNNIESVLFGIIDKDKELMDEMYYQNQNVILKELQNTDWRVMV